MPTNEEALKKYAGGGYEIVFIHGTCHFPMIEKPEEFNRSMQNVIEKLEVSNTLNFVTAVQMHNKD